MTDYFKMDQQDLTNLFLDVKRVLEQREKVELNGDLASSIWGNEMGKRAASIAVAGGHTILFFGPTNSGKTMLRSLCNQLGLSPTFESNTCPCGNHNDPFAICNCTTEQVNEIIQRFPKVDIYIEVCRPREREIGQKGTSLQDMKKRLETVKKYPSMKLDEFGTGLMSAAIKQLVLDIPEQDRILAVARTIANLDDSKFITAAHIAEAVNYRRPRLLTP